jgi:hypothetical protein
MTTEQQFKGRDDLIDAFGDLAVQVFKWVALVTAIAVGVCAGLFLFFKLVGAEMQHDMQSVWTPTITTTPSYAP